MYQPLYAPRPVRINWAAVAAFVVTLGSAGCVLAAFILGHGAHATSTIDKAQAESSGILGMLALLASVGGAFLGLILSIVGVTLRKNTRGLSLAIVSMLLSGGWALTAAGFWIWLWVTQP